MASRFSPLFALSVLLNGALATIEFDPSCSNKDALLADTISIAKAGYDALNNPGSREGNDPWTHWTIMSTYDAFFDASIPDSPARWDGIKSDLDAVINVQNSQERILVVCDDEPYWLNWLETETHRFFQLPGTDQTYYYPKDDVSSSPCAIKKKFADGEAYSFGYALPLPGITVIVQCRKQFNAGELSSEVVLMEGSVYPTGYWSYNLGHELLHAVGKDFLEFADEKYHINSYSIRSTNGNKNPDSVMLFSTAMMDKNWYWQSGKASTRKKAYDHWKDNAPNIIEVWGLTDPGSSKRNSIPFYS